MKIALGVALVLSLAAIMYFGATRLLEQQRAANEITRLRDQLYRARVTADRCQRSIASSEGALQEFRLRLDSLKARVDSFEALDPRGVPQEQYDTYMEAFTVFNDSAGSWELREEQLRTADSSCRDVIVRHNALQDTLQTVLAEAGIETN